MCIEQNGRDIEKVDEITDKGKGGRESLFQHNRPTNC
jgi:hypothetical protein